MSYHLIVQPLEPYAVLAGEAESQLFNWVLMDSVGERQAGGSGDSKDVIEQTLRQNALDGVRLIGLLPADEALVCYADIPAKQQRFIHQALPFAVEEQLAQDVDSVHLALGERTDRGYRVAAIDKLRMSQWMEAYSDFEGAQLEAIIPDSAMLPVNDTDWTICVDGSMALMASSQGDWMRIRTENLVMFAQTLDRPSEDEVVAEVKVRFFAPESYFEENAESLAAMNASGRLSVSRSSLEAGAVELLARAHSQQLDKPLNLCQGAYAVQGKGGSKVGPWKPAIAVACVWFVLQLGFELGMGIYHERGAESAESQAMAIYKQAFPQDRRAHPGNLKRMVSSRLNSASAQGPSASFLALMKQTGAEYVSLPQRQAVEFNSINFSQSRGELVVDVRADSYDKLSALRSGLANKGLNAEIGSVVNESNGTRGRLTVSGG